MKTKFLFSITGLVMAFSLISFVSVQNIYAQDGNPVRGSGEEREPVTGSGEKPSYCTSIDQGELESSIIPCGRKVHICYDEENAQCEFRHLFDLVNNMARSFITLVFAPLLTITLMYIGFLFIKDQAAAKTKAKMLLSRLLIGTFFVLGAWLIVNFILNSLETEDEIKQPLQTSSTN